MTEQGFRSQALRDVFLPHRRDVLRTFLEDQCEERTLVDDGRTIGGGEVGAPN